MESRVTFSIAILFRAISILCFFFGWLALVRVASPVAAFGAVCGLGVAMSMFVAVRRLGSRCSKLVAGAIFLVQSSVVACYSAIVATYLRLPREDEDQQLGIGLIMLFGFPVFVTVLVFMLRGWTWSAHDDRMRKSSPSN